ncbi:hypothetical protein BTO00_22635, partial [Vibrio campbellii]
MGVVAFDTFTRLQSRIDSSNVILAWSTETSDTAPTLEHYVNADIDGVSADNLSDVNTQLQSRNLTDMSDVQPFVDAVNKVLAYTAGTREDIAVNDYFLSGITGVTEDNAEVLHRYVYGQSQTFTQIQELVTQADYLLVLINYSANASNNDEPEGTDYRGAGIAAATDDDVGDYNRELVNQSTKLDLANIADVDAEAKIQALVEAINTLDDYATGPN